MNQPVRIARPLTTLLALSLLLTGCFGRGPKGPQPPQTFEVIGSVRSLQPGEPPISGAQVTVNGVQAATDEFGNFALAKVPRRDGYASYFASAEGHWPTSGSMPVQGDLLELPLVLAPQVVHGDGEVYGTLNFAVPAFNTGICSAPSSRTLYTPPPTALLGDQPLLDEVIVELSEPPTEEAAKRLMQATGAPGFRIPAYIERLVLAVPPGVTIDDFVRELLAQPEVVDAYPNGHAVVLGAPAVPDDPCFNVQHHLHQINAPMAWTVTTGEPGIVVAVLDSGVDTDHPDLAPNLLPGWNAFDGTDDVHDSSEHGHGTHVAGIIGAVANNGLGVAGTAWNVSILPVKVIDGRHGPLSEVAAGIRYAADAGAHVINMSFGINADVPVIRDAVEYAAAKGAVLVAAVGNTGMGFATTVYPARYEEVIGVGASAMHRPTAAASFSLRGPGIDVVAPGEAVWSTVPGRYGAMSGTSMATPVVSGVAALMLAQGIPATEVRDILQRTAVRIGEPATDPGALFTAGYGLVNAYGAVLGLDPGDALVFVMDQGGIIYGEPTTPDLERRFTVTRVPAYDGLHVVAWLDVNGDGTLDPGDYFGAAPISGPGRVDLYLAVYWGEAENELASAAAEAIERLGRMG